MTTDPTIIRFTGILLSPDRPARAVDIRLSRGRGRVLLAGTPDRLLGIVDDATTVDDLVRMLGRAWPDDDQPAAVDDPDPDRIISQRFAVDAISD